MKIEKLIADLQKLQKLYPNAEIYFTDSDGLSWFETHFQTFNIDEENNQIEMLFDTEGR
jgi:hypothetical protein